MQFGCYVFQFLFLFASKGGAIKVFNFDDTTRASAVDNLSYVSLSNSPTDELPERFILCSSHIQRKIDNKNFYVLYDDENVPWFSLSIWEVGGNITLWAEAKNGWWHNFGNTGKPWTNFWMHICIDIDLIAGKLSASINGRPIVTEEAAELLTDKPSKLNLILGLVDHSWQRGQQFPDSVANINVFHSSGQKTIGQLSMNPCLFASAGDYMAWSEMTWNKTGKYMRELEVEDGIVCDVGKDYKIPLPIEMTWPETKQTCTNLGHAKVTEVSTKDELFEFVTWFDKEHGPCRDIWTPFTDDKEEGVFISTNNDKPVDFLPWMIGQPNGGTLQNNLAIRATSDGLSNITSESLNYHDVKYSNQYCGSCSLDKRTSFTLWGRCEFTYLGK